MKYLKNFTLLRRAGVLLTIAPNDAPNKAEVANCPTREGATWPSRTEPALVKKTAQARNKVWSRNLEREDSGEVGLLVHHRSPQQAAQAIGDANDAEHEAGGGAVQPPGL